MSADTSQAGTANLLQLYVQAEEEGAASAYVPVRWCLTPALIEQIEQRRFRKPYLVIAVRTKRTEHYAGDHTEETWDQTNRYIVPLQREMAYVTFTRPGENELRATVVDLYDSDDAKTVSKARELFNQDGTPALRRTYVPLIEGAVGYQPVYVPRDMFAKEPPQWLKSFVNTFFDAPARDQCQFRRRVLGSCPLAVILLTVGMAFRLIVGTVGLFLGLRKFRWRGFLPFEDTLPLGDSTLWYTDKYGNADPARFPLWFLNPVTLTVLPAIVFGIMNYRQHHGNSHAVYPLSNMGWWQTVAYVDGALVALVVVIGLIVGLVLLFDLIRSAVTQSTTYSKRRRENRQRKLQEEAFATRQLYATLSAMTCTQASSDVRVSALPTEKRTVALRYNELKASVCKPFAR